MKLLSVGLQLEVAGKAIRSFIGASVVVILAIDVTNAEAIPPVVHDGLSEPVEAWRTAMEAGDRAAMARMNGPRTIGFPPGQKMIAGTAAIMEDYTRLFAAYQARVTFEEPHWVEQGSLVVSWGLYTLILHPRGSGADVVTHGRFTDAAVRDEGGWLYLVDHASVPTPK